MRAFALCAAVVVSLSPGLAWASEAAFSGDGTTLWVLSKGGDAVSALNMDGTPATQHPLKLPALPDNRATHLLWDAGSLLVATDAKLWRWKPEAQAEEIAIMPTSFHVHGMSRAEGEGFQGCILINGEHIGEQAGRLAASLYGLRPGEKTFRGFFTRHVRSVTACPVFANGRMVFGGDHDLWEGGLQSYGQGEDDQAGYLWGYRTAPLAALMTDEGNGEGPGTRTVALVDNRIWVALSGRHGGGSLLNVPFASPKTPTPETLPGRDEMWKLYRSQLAATKVVPFREDAGAEAYDSVWELDAMCGWSGPDGRWKIAFRTIHRIVWLLEKGAKEPRKIGETPRD